MRRKRRWRGIIDTVFASLILFVYCLIRDATRTDCSYRVPVADCYPIAIRSLKHSMYVFIASRSGSKGAGGIGGGATAGRHRGVVKKMTVVIRKVDNHLSMIRLWLIVAS